MLPLPLCLQLDCGPPRALPDILLPRLPPLGRVSFGENVPAPAPVGAAENFLTYPAPCCCSGADHAALAMAHLPRSAHPVCAQCVLVHQDSQGRPQADVWPAPQVARWQQHGGHGGSTSRSLGRARGRKKGALSCRLTLTLSGLSHFYFGPLSVPPTHPRVGHPPLASLVLACASVVMPIANVPVGL